MTLGGTNPAVTFPDGTIQNSAFNGTALSASPYTTSLGANTLVNNSGTANTAVGNGALQANTTNSNNTAIGYQSLYANTVGGGDNTAIGYSSAVSNTTGYNLVAVGSQALKSNTTGNNNTAVGYQALISNTAASNNTAVGYQAGYTQTINGATTYIGNQSGYLATGAYNVGVGFDSLYQVTGTYNVGVGPYAGYGLTSGGNNTFIGPNAGYYVTTGSNNVIIGNYSGNQGGLDIRTASNYIVLSDGAGNPVAYWSNNKQMYMGNSTYGTAINGLTNGGGFFISGTDTVNNPSLGYNIGHITSTSAFQVRVGSSGGVYLAGGATSWTALSDPRLKNVTGTYTTALADIAQIKSIKFTWKNDLTNKPQVGVDATSVQNIVPEAMDTTKVSKEDETEYLAVRYTELIPLVIASIQELNAKVTALEAQLAAKG
jgi:hypothetical protein